MGSQKTLHKEQNCTARTFTRTHKIRKSLRFYREIQGTVNKWLTTFKN